MGGILAYPDQQLFSLYLLKQRTLTAAHFKRSPLRLYCAWQDYLMLLTCTLYFSTQNLYKLNVSEKLVHIGRNTVGQELLLVTTALVMQGTICHKG